MAGISLRSTSQRPHVSINAYQVHALTPVSGTFNLNPLDSRFWADG